MIRIIGALIFLIVLFGGSYLYSILPEAFFYAWYGFPILFLWIFSGVVLMVVGISMMTGALRKPKQ